MNIERDLERIAEQEQRLRLAQLDADVAWELGGRLRAAAAARGAALAIEVRIARQTIFFCAMAGTAPVNADWARRKRNVAELHGRSSYAVGLALKLGGGSLEEKLGLPARDYAAHGGSFPLALVGAGPIGTLTVSGLPQREDHGLIVAVLAEHLGLPAADLALE